MPVLKNSYCTVVLFSSFFVPLIQFFNIRFKNCCFSCIKNLKSLDFVCKIANLSIRMSSYLSELSHLSDPSIPSYPLPFVTALFSFLYHMAYFEVGKLIHCLFRIVLLLMKVAQWSSGEYV